MRNIALKILMILSLLTGYSFFAVAQTYYGGQVTAKAISSQTLTYEVIVTLYVPLSGDLVFNKQELYFGHGKPVELLSGQPGFEHACNNDSSACIERYRLTHTFPGYGTYKIGYRRHNRFYKVSNIKNAVNNTQYLETNLTIDPVMGLNSTPIPTDTFTYQTHTLTRFVHPVQATDLDGDSLTYELVVPLHNKDTLVEGYRFPDEFDLYYLENPVKADGSTPPLFIVEEGNIIWDAPNYRGVFTVALRIHEWRNVQGVWTPLGYVTREMDIYVKDTTIITSTEKEFFKSKLKLFPNPSSGKFQLTLPDESWKDGQISIYDLMGQQIFQSTIQSSMLHFDLSTESSGLYFLILQKNNWYRELKFIIHK